MKTRELVDVKIKSPKKIINTEKSTRTPVNKEKSKIKSIDKVKFAIKIIQDEKSPIKSVSKNSTIEPVNEEKTIKPTNKEKSVIKLDNEEKSSNKVKSKLIKISAKDTDKLQESPLCKAVSNVKQILQTKGNVEKKKKNPIEMAKISEKVSEESAREKVYTSTRGVIYIGHIPHGFYEEQMRDHFKQFGQVTRAKVVRSRKNGRSCGFGYVEFAVPDVAKIAAKTMNNYLMYGRLLKVVFIPPEKQHAGLFTGRPYTKDNYPGLKNGIKEVQLKNAKVLKKSVARLFNLEKRLEAAGVSFKIKPVDVPLAQ